jgi:hypothetical protein
MYIYTQAIAGVASCVASQFFFLFKIFFLEFSDGIDLFHTRLARYEVFCVRG